ncbi:MAG: esterase-like activity of phytase family protein [Hyphomicrobium sp.]
MSNTLIRTALPALLLSTLASMLASILGLSLPAVAADETQRLRLEIADSRSIDAATFEGFKIKELSGLAWDADEQVLFAVSDKGWLTQFQLDVQQNKIAALNPVQSVRLADEAGIKLDKHLANAEGLAALNASNGIKGDTELLVVFEEVPAIGRFAPDGRRLEQIEVPAPVNDPSLYSSPTNGLESITHHADLGILTVTEEPLAKAERDQHTIFSTRGARYSFPAHRLGRGNIKDIEACPNGKLLVLERMRSGPEKRIVSALRLLDPAQCRDGPGDTLCNVIDVDQASQQLPEANFEGLTRISPDLFLVVSDDRIDDTRRSLFVLVRLTRARPAGD